MTFTLTIQDMGFAEMIAEKFQALKVPVQAAMANRFASIVHNNFGFGGEDRPSPWPALSSQYAKEFHGGNRIPTLQLSGELQESIQIQETNPEFSEVFTENEYAMSHQFGDESSNLPARPFFPMFEDGTLTPYAEAEVIAAAKNEADRILTQN